MPDRALALIEILEKCCFRKTLCIDVTDEIRRALELRSDVVFSFNSDQVNLFSELSNDKFDLVISFSDDDAVIRELGCFRHNQNCEILIISDSLFTYNPASTRKGFLARRSRRSLLCQTKQIFNNFSIERYYPFPDVYKPEMILSKKGLSSLYFRYWSWRKLEENLIGKVLESLFVSLFRSPIFSPQIIIKLTNGDT